jgi:deoxyadenosine/deoxycytidine kinase
MNNKFICIEGNIGAGKTTLSQMLAKHYKAKLMLENFETNPYLKDFYIDSKKFALQVELSFLTDRYQQHLSFINENETIVSDYFFDKSLIFARINLNSNELKVFEATFFEARTQIKKPDIIIFLDATEDLLDRNIKKRGRNFEENISTTYLQKITNAYHSYLKQNTMICPVIWVNVNEYDLINNVKNFHKLTNLIDSKISNDGYNLCIFN